jgi:hypothetical protein
MGQLGPLPDDVGAGVGGRFFVLWPRVAVTLGVHHWFARSQAIAPASDLRAEISLTAAQLSGCARLGVATVEFPLCTGIELGALVGRSLQIEEPGADRLLWGAWLAQAGIGWSPLRRFAAHIDLGMIVPLRRYRFAVDNIGTVFEPAPVGLRFGGSVAIRFP